MNLNKETLRLNLFFAGVVLSMIGFLWSRAFLSMGVITLCANGILFSNIREQWDRFRSNPFLTGLTLLFFIPFISGLWSSDLTEWWVRCQQKIPLLLLPFSLAVQPGLTRKHLLWMKLLWMALMVLGSVWSMVHYIQEQKLFYHLYLRSKVLPTLAGNDHIRFSIGVVIALLFWLWIEQQKQINDRRLLWLMRALMLWLIVFLHIMGVKTGLLGLYGIVFPVMIWNGYKAGYKWQMGLVILIIFSLPFVAYHLLPTFKARVHYVLYDKNLWQKEQFSGQESDGNRVLSIRSGWYVWQKDLITGVGYGDVREEASLWYNDQAPQVARADRFLPLNQWLMMGSGAGMLSALVFTLIIFLPFADKKWWKIAPALGWILFMNLVFLYESTLEDQLGVFVYTFFTLWWYLETRIES